MFVNVSHDLWQWSGPFYIYLVNVKNDMISYPIKRAVEISQVIIKVENALYYIVYAFPSSWNATKCYEMLWLSIIIYLLRRKKGKHVQNCAVGSLIRDPKIAWNSIDMTKANNFSLRFTIFESIFHANVFRQLKCTNEKECNNFPCTSPPCTHFEDWNSSVFVMAKTIENTENHLRPTIILIFHAIHIGTVLSMFKQANKQAKIMVFKFSKTFWTIGARTR